MLHQNKQLEVGYKMIELWGDAEHPRRGWVTLAEKWPEWSRLQLNSQFLFSITALFEFIWIMDLTFIWIMWIKHNNLSYKMTEAIRKENIIEMPDGSDMIA